MPSSNPQKTWKTLIQTWLTRQLEGWVPRPTAPGAPVLPPGPYPDYLTCPKCGEPEVEVWCYEAQARCHQCAHVFVNTHQPACAPLCPPENQVRRAGARPEA